MSMVSSFLGDSVVLVNIVNTSCRVDRVADSVQKYTKN